MTTIRSGDNMKTHVTFEVKKLAKKYQRQWVFKNLDFLSNTHSVSVRGSNGSGKSTFLKCLIGLIPPTSGQVFFKDNGVNIKLTHKNYAFAAPYLDVIENITLKEYFDFYSNLKPLISNMDYDHFVDILELKIAVNKRFSEYSTGMLQRVKIAFALCSNTPIVILDEPTSNLDIRAIEWYQQLIQKTQKDHDILIIASNEERDFIPNSQSLFIEDFK